MKLDSLDTLFLDQIKDLLGAETQLIKALPKMAKAATSEDLKKAFSTHLEQTREHAARLEQVMELLDQKPRKKKCKAMEGLIEEGSEILEADGEDHVIDAALIGAAQRVEHYEIAAYGTARTLAEQLGHNKAVKLLQKTLDEEKETDELLTNLAMSHINADAGMA